MAYRTRVNDLMAASIKSYGVRSRHLSSPWRRQTDYAAALFLYVKGVCSRVGPLPRGFKRCVSRKLVSFACRNHVGYHWGRACTFSSNQIRDSLVRCSDTFWELRVPHSSVISTVFDSFREVELPLTSCVPTVVGLHR